MIRKVELLFAALGLIVATCWAYDSSPNVSSAQERVPNPEDEAEKIAADIVTIDMSKVFAGSQQYLGLRKKLADESAEAKQEASEMVKRLNELKTDLKKFPRGSDGYEKLKDESDALTIKLKNFSEKGKRKIEKFVADTYLEIYQSAKKEIKEYAGENKIRLVQNFSDKEITTTDPKKILTRMQRNILYADVPDITDEIIKRINQQNAGLKQPGSPVGSNLAQQ